MRYYKALTLCEQRKGKSNAADTDSKIKALTHIVFKTHESRSASSSALRMSGKDHVYPSFEEERNGFFYPRQFSPK